MTKLEAVNEILEALGEPPVAALDTGGTSIEGEAETHLDRANRRIQKRGWFFNTIPERTYTPDVSDQVSLGADVLKIRPVFTSTGPHTRTTDTLKRYGIRDGLLYDFEADADDEFTEDVHLEVIELVAFDELTEALATYVTKAASLDFVRYKKRGQVDDAFARSELAAAKVAAEQEDQDYGRTNVLDTPGMRQVRGRRRHSHWARGW